MLGSRSLNLCRVASRISTAVAKRQISTTQSLKSGGTWSYRQAAPPAPAWNRYGAEAAGGFMWWWILWHLWHEPEHIYGEFPYPDPSAWTNAELGIPPDDEGLAEKIEN